MESRRNGPQLSSRHDDDDDYVCVHVYVGIIVFWVFFVLV